MTEQPDLSTLPKRMRYAASVLEEATDWCNENQPGTNTVWNAYLLFKNADVREAEDREAAERKHIVEELAQELRDSSAKAPIRRTEEYRELAQHLVESGWRKEQP